VQETGSLRVGSGTEAGGGFGVAASLATDWDWEDLEFFLVVGLVMVDWVCACGSGVKMGGDDEGVAPVAGLVAGAAMVAPPAATAVAREELGGEAEGADWFMAGGVGVAPCAGVLADVVWIREVVCGGVAVVGDLGKLWLL